VLLKAQCAALVCASLAFLVPRAAHANSEAALAETLYRTARELMAAGKHAEACPKFAESYRLDPATGTLLNLAACHEAQGKFASAWVEFTDAAAAAKRDGRADRVEYAEQHVKDLEPKLSYLTVTTAPGVDPASLQITLDGAAVGVAALGVRAPLDPGQHVVTAKATGKVEFSQTVLLGAVADQQIVTIPGLQDLPPPVVAAPAVPALGPGEPAPPQTANAATGSETTAPGAEPGLPTSVLAAGGATLAFGAGAIVTGVLYLQRRSDYNEGTSPAERDADYDSAQSLGYANLALTALTLGGAALTGYFYFSQPEPGTTASVAPSLGPGFAGLSARGEF